MNITFPVRRVLSAGLPALTVMALCLFFSPAILKGSGDIVARTFYVATIFLVTSFISTRVTLSKGWTMALLILAYGIALQPLLALESKWLWNFRHSLGDGILVMSLGLMGGFYRNEKMPDAFSGFSHVLLSIIITALGMIGAWYGSLVLGLLLTGSGVAVLAKRWVKIPSSRVLDFHFPLCILATAAFYSALPPYAGSAGAAAFLGGEWICRLKDNRREGGANVLAAKS